MMARVLKWILLFTLVFGALGAALYWYGSQDLPGYDDRGLVRLSQEQPDRGFNAADHLAFLKDENFSFSLSPALREKLHQDLEFKEWSLPEVMEVLAANQAYIESFVYASDQAYLRLSVTPGKPLDLPDHDSFFVLSRLVTLKARLLLASGNVGAAIDHALVPLKFSALLMRDYGEDAIISFIIGSALQSKSLQLIKDIATAADTGAEQVARLQVAIERLPRFWEDRFDRTLGIMIVRDVDYAHSMVPPSLPERIELFRQGSEILKGGESAVDWTYRLITTLLPRYFVHVNRYSENYSLRISALASQYMKPCALLEYPPAPAHYNPLAWLGPLSPNVGGDYGAGYSEWFGSYLHRRCLLYTEREAIETQLAYERYRFKYSEYPSRPLQLVPEFLDSAPLDFFDGKPLRYSASGRFLYSVGENGIDDGGNLDFAELGYYQCSRDSDCRSNPTFALPAVNKVASVGGSGVMHRTEHTH